MSMLHNHVVGYEILDLSLGPGLESLDWGERERERRPNGVIRRCGTILGLWVLEPIPAAGRYMYVSGILC